MAAEGSGTVGTQSLAQYPQGGRSPPFPPFSASVLSHTGFLSIITFCSLLQAKGSRRALAGGVLSSRATKHNTAIVPSKDTCPVFQRGRGKTWFLLACVFPSFPETFSESCFLCCCKNGEPHTSWCFGATPSLVLQKSCIAGHGTWGSYSQQL